MISVFFIHFQSLPTVLHHSWRLEQRQTGKLRASPHCLLPPQRTSTASAPLKAVPRSVWPPPPPFSPRLLRETFLAGIHGPRCRLWFPDSWLLPCNETVQINKGINIKVLIVSSMLSIFLPQKLLQTFSTNNDHLTILTYWNFQPFETSLIQFHFLLRALKGSVNYVKHCATPSNEIFHLHFFLEKS